MKWKWCVRKGHGIFYNTIPAFVWRNYATSQDCWHPKQESNQAPFKHKSKAVTFALASQCFPYQYHKDTALPHNYRSVAMLCTLISDVSQTRHGNPSDLNKFHISFKHTIIKGYKEFIIVQNKEELPQCSWYWIVTALQFQKH